MAGKIRTRSKILSILLIVIMLLSGCGGLDLGMDSGSTIKNAKEEGTITVGFANEKPYAYKDKSGKVTGEAVEIARTIFKKIGIKKINPVLVEFGSLIPGLKSKRFDVITAGMYITPKRCKEVQFADPEYSIGEALAVKKGNPKDLHSYLDIKENPKIKVAVMKGAIETSYLKDLGVKQNQIVIAPDQPSVISALKSGRVDAVTMTETSLASSLKSANAKGIEEVKDFKQPIIKGKSVRGFGAAAFRKEDTKLRNAFNAELKKMKKSNQLLKILESFGYEKDNLPGDKTAEQLCKSK